MSSTETAIIRGMISSEEYARKIVPHVELEYFREQPSRIAYEICRNIFTKYGTIPTKTQLEVECSRLVGRINDKVLIDVAKLVVGLEPNAENVPWLVDTTEKFCQDAAFYNASATVMAILSGEEKKLTKEAVPEIFRQALGVCFDTRVGHDYFEDAEKRWDYYHQDVNRVRFKIDQFNIITGGGLPDKTITTPLGGTNVGKTALLCAFAADFISQGYDVLYVSGEMSEEKIAERVDANLLDMTIAEVHGTHKEYFLRRLEMLRPGFGKLVVVEYPARKASVQTVDKLLYDLEIKKKFRPRILLLDYLTSFKCTSIAPSSGMYERGKALAEEFRGLGVERCIPVVAPIQTNRGGQGSTNSEFDDVGESHGISQAADFMFSVSRPEALKQSKQLLINVFKNRLGPAGHKFVVGFDFAKMKMYPCSDQSAAGSDQIIIPERDVAPITTANGLRLDDDEEITFNFKGM